MKPARSEDWSKSVSPSTAFSKNQASSSLFLNKQEMSINIPNFDSEFDNFLKPLGFLNF